MAGSSAEYRGNLFQLRYLNWVECWRSHDYFAKSAGKFFLPLRKCLSLGQRTKADNQVIDILRCSWWELAVWKLAATLSPLQLWLHFIGSRVLWDELKRTWKVVNKCRFFFSRNQMSILLKIQKTAWNPKTNRKYWKCSEGLAAAVENETEHVSDSCFHWDSNGLLNYLHHQPSKVGKYVETNRIRNLFWDIHSNKAQARNPVCAK